MKKLIKVVGLIGLITIIIGVIPSFAALQYQETYTSQAGTQKVLIVVNSSIYDAIYEASLKQYIADLEAEDYNITLTKYIGGTPQELKNYFKLFSGLKGVILIGDLPVPWFEIITGRGSDEIFPIDLFYTDFNSTWQDLDNNGYYDKIIGNPFTANIWLGRLTSSPLYNPSMDQVALLKNYFAKNHAYRIGLLPVQKRALAYVDDDFIGNGNCSLDLAYSNVTVINDKVTTCATDYKNRLKENYEWINLIAHSSFPAHSFKINDVWENTYVWYYDIRTIDPTALFYNLIACLTCAYNFSDYIGGHYIFAKTNGLLAVGSTKIMGMAYLDKFYPYLGPNYRQSVGEALRNWFLYLKSNVAPDSTSYYGHTILGDPTLTLDPPIASIVSINPSPANKGQTVTFNGSGKISTGSITAYSWRSSKDGYLSGNSSFSTSSLSVGDHTMCFKVKDNRGRWSSEAKSTLTITDTSVTLSVGTITPASGSSTVGTAVTFTTTYIDPKGYSDIKWADFLVNTSASEASCFFAYYERSSNKLYLRNDANTSFLGGYAPGSTNVMENSYAKIDCAKTTVSGSANTLTINWNIAFKSGSLGAKNMYLRVFDSAGANTGLLQKGTWTIN